jgi:hypothetical protein
MPDWLDRRRSGLWTKFPEPGLKPGYGGRILNIQDPEQFRALSNPSKN